MQPKPGESRPVAPDGQEPQRDPLPRVWFRSVVLAFFCAPSIVGAGGPTRAFFLPGPAFLMLLFGQFRFKFWLGLLPILLSWPLFLLWCCVRAKWLPRSKQDEKKVTFCMTPVV